MKMWRLLFLLLICSGLCVAFVLGGCGDNPCENAEPSTCANIVHAVPDSCLVVEEEDFACLCCGPESEDMIPCEDNPDLETKWNENSKTCDVVPEN
jgi:hypothetical protein